MDPMRDDENASTPKKKASRAFYSELPDEVDSLYSLQKARIEEEAEEGAAKNRDLAHFRSVVKNHLDLPARIESRREVFAIPVLSVSQSACPQQPRTPRKRLLR
jgi:hypothetical protein